MNNLDIAKKIVAVLDKRKADDISLIDIMDCSIIGDYFVIATATSSTHIKSLAGEIEDKLSDEGIEPHHIEGRTSGWLLMDYSDIIVHLFTKDQREYYNLQRLWADGHEVDCTDIFEQNKISLESNR